MSQFAAGRHEVVPGLTESSEQFHVARNVEPELLRRTSRVAEVNERRSKQIDAWDARDVHDDGLPRGCVVVR